MEVKIVYIGSESLDRTKPSYTLHGHDYPYHSLTLGKVYNSIYHSIGECYTLINDLGKRYSYKSCLFKTVEEVRNERIFNILNNE